MGGGGGINQHPACTAAPGIVGAGQLLPVTGEVGIMWAERASKDGEDAPPRRAMEHSSPLRGQGHADPSRPPLPSNYTLRPQRKISSLKRNGKKTERARGQKRQRRRGGSVQPQIKPVQIKPGINPSSFSATQKNSPRRKPARLSRSHEDIYTLKKPTA